MPAGRRRYSLLGIFAGGAGVSERDNIQRNSAITNSSTARISAPNPAMASPPLADPQNCTEAALIGMAKFTLAVPCQRHAMQAMPRTSISNDATNHSLDFMRVRIIQARTIG